LRAPQITDMIILNSLSLVDCTKVLCCYLNIKFVNIKS